jgi:hypothetical protein
MRWCFFYQQEFLENYYMLSVLANFDKLSVKMIHTCYLTALEVRHLKQGSWGQVKVLAGVVFSLEPLGTNLLCSFCLFEFLGAAHTPWPVMVGQWLFQSKLSFFPDFIYKDPWDYSGPTCITQDHLPSQDS